MLVSEEVQEVWSERSLEAELRAGSAEVLSADLLVVHLDDRLVCAVLRRLHCCIGVSLFILLIFQEFFFPYLMGSSDVSCICWMEYSVPTSTGSIDSASVLIFCAFLNL